MRTEIWWERVLWRRYVYHHTHLHIQLKKSGILHTQLLKNLGIPHTHTHTQLMRGFSSKWGRVRVIPTGMGLFVISS